MHTFEVEIHRLQKVCRFGRYDAKAKLFCQKSFVPVTRAGVFIWENFHPGYRDLGASSYEPGQPGWLGFRDLAPPLFPSLKFRCVHMRGRAGPVTEISVFATVKISPYV